jgi:hypothetical protein
MNANLARILSSIAHCPFVTFNFFRHFRLVLFSICNLLSYLFISFDITFDSVDLSHYLKEEVTVGEDDDMVRPYTNVSSARVHEEMKCCVGCTR